MEHCKTCKKWKHSSKIKALSDFGHVCEFESDIDESNWTYLLEPGEEGGEYHSAVYGIAFMPGPGFGCVHHDPKQQRKKQGVTT